MLPFTANHFPISSTLSEVANGSHRVRGTLALSVTSSSRKHHANCRFNNSHRLVIIDCSVWNRRTFHIYVSLLIWLWWMQQLWRHFPRPKASEITRIVAKILHQITQQLNSSPYSWTNWIRLYLVTNIWMWLTRKSSAACFCPWLFNTM